MISINKLLVKSKSNKDPYRVDKNVNIIVMDEHGEGREDVPDGLHRRRGVLVPAQVHHHPGHVAQERNGYVGVDEGEERLDDA